MTDNIWWDELLPQGSYAPCHFRREVLHAIKDRPDLSEIPVFVVTAKGLTEAENRMLKGEVRGLFRKDASWKADLLAELRKAVGKTAFAKTVGQS